MATNINNYSESWDGHTGAEVKEFITRKLLGNETAILNVNNNALVGLTAGYKTVDGQEDKTTIQITGTTATGLTVTAEFSTITESAYTQVFNTKNEPEFYTCEAVVPKGKNLSIPYDYYVEKDGQRVRGLSAEVTFTISGAMGVKTCVLSTYQSSSSSTLKAGTFTIPSSLLSVGANTIQMRAITKSGNTQTLPYDATFTTYVADLSLDVNIPDFQELKDADKNFTMSFIVKDSLGRSIPSGQHYKVKAYVQNIRTNTLVGQGFTASSINASFNSLFGQTSYYQSTTPGPQVTLIFQAVMTDENGNDLVLLDANDQNVNKSNTVMINMLNRTAINLEGNSLHSAVKLTNVDIPVNYSTRTIHIQQYETATFDIYLYAHGADMPYQITLDEEVKASGTIQTGQLSPTELEYSYVFRNASAAGTTYALTLADLLLSIDVAALDTSLQEPSNAGLDLNASEKAVGTSDDEWTDSNNTSCTFQNFDWVSNGWVRTDDGTALLLNNGANLTIDYKVCDSSAYQTENYPFTVSIKYKIKNGFNLAEELISCANNTTGFVVKPTYVGLKTSSIISQNISNDDVHEVTFVYYGNASSAGIYKGTQAIYIDGKIQAMSKSGAFVPHTNKIIVQATQASLYLYSIKAYRRALSFTEIQSIYCFNQANSAKIAKYVNDNNIFNGDTSTIGNYSQSIDRTKLPKGSAVLVLYGSDIDRDSFKTINGYAKNEANKKAIHKLDHVMFYIAGYDAHARNFYMEGGGLGAQGTSSMAYPVKNYRLYTNKASKNVAYDLDCSVTAMYQGDSENPLPWNFDPNAEGVYTAAQIESWTMDKYGKAYAYSLRRPDYGEGYNDCWSAPANRFCLKADYAESSGVHNTGFARFSNDIMKSSTAIHADNFTSTNEESRLPQQHAVSGSGAVWKYDVRSNIDGFPVYVFFEVPADEENSLPAESYFCGRYNMNNDKSNVHVFGFEKVDDYFNNPIVAAEGKYLQQMALAIDPNYAKTHCAAADAEFINPTECWEFSSNEGTSRLIGSFYQNVNNAFDITTGEPDGEVATIANGLSWINTTWEPRYPDISGAVKGSEDYELPYRDGSSKPYLLYKTYEFLNQNNYALHPNINALNNFAERLHLFFNVNSVIKYFILTHWFCSMDQRIKNSMLAFYCDPYGVTPAEANESPLHYMRAYYIFYDNDTILGLNNSGAIKQPWDFYETDEGLIDGTESKYATEAYTGFPGNGIHGIWTNLQKCYEYYRDGQNTTSSAYALGKLVNDAYVSLRSAATDATIEKYFETDQCNQYPAAVHNTDLELKYLNPNITSTTIVDIPCNLDMAQGTREFHRKNWLGKRTLWLDDLYKVNTEDYALRYKTANANGFDNGTITLTSDPAFRFWRFYQNNGATNRQTSFLTPSDTGSITIPASSEGTLSQSDYFILSGLYGCKTLDFSNYNFDAAGMGTCDAGSKGLPFPYLQTFIMRKYDSNTFVQCSDGGSIFSWITPKMLPNLKQLHFCHVHPRTGGTGFFDTYNLRDSEGNEFTNLELLDLRDTQVSSVVLPNSSSLVSLSLDNPIEITISNKPNITTINIGTANLNKLIVNTSSSAVYNWALTAANTLYGENSKIITIQFGNGANNPYVIDQTNVGQLALLNQLAIKYINRNQSAESLTTLNITGHIYTTEDFDLENVSDAFPGLNVSSQLVTDGFSFGNIGDLYEDSVAAQMQDGTATNLSDLTCLEVRANMPVVSWAIAVDGDTTNTLDDRIKIVKTQALKCWIHADPYAQNSKIGVGDHTLTVYATLADGTTYSSYELNNQYSIIYYKPINSLTLSTDTEYVTDTAIVDFNFGEHTKRHLLNRTYVESNSSDFSISATNANVTLRYDADDMLIGANVTLSSLNDSVVTANILGAQATINIYYDSNLIADRTTVTNTDPKYWMKLLIAAAEQQHSIGNAIRKSDAAKIQIMDSRNYWATMMSGLSEVSTAQDFSDLKYFQLGSTTDGVFTIPDVPFTNITTPKNTTGVIWTSLANDTSNIANVIMGSTVKKLVVSLTFNGALPENMQIDLSQTQITKIGAYGTSINGLTNYNASVQLTCTSGSVSSTRPLSLFVYPSTITELGNTNLQAADLVGNSPATLMFNLTDGQNAIGNSSSTAYAVLSSLDGFDTSSGITLGAITSYRSKGSAITLSWAKVLQVSRAFVYYDNVNLSNGVFTLPSVQKVLAQSFYVDGNYVQNQDVVFQKLYLNAQVNEIGDEAFNRANFTVHNASNSSADIAVFDNVTTIGAKAFFNSSVAQTLRFGNNLTSVGAQAFEEANNVNLIIYINKTDALTSVQSSSFGSATSHTIIRVPANSDLYTQLTASGMDCRNHVETYSF